MQVDLHVGVVLLDALDDVEGRLRLEQGSHVLEGDGVGAHVDEAVGLLDEALRGVDRGGRVADRALGVLADALDGGHRVLEVAGIVEGVEDAEDVHAILGGLLDELVDDLVVVVTVTQQVLPTQQHLQTGVGHQLAEGAKPLPRVFIEETDAGIEGSSTPALDGPVASSVDVGASVDHVFQ